MIWTPAVLCYIQDSKTLGTCTLACLIAEVLITVQYPPTELQGSIPIWHTEMVLLNPCSQILCPLLFLSSPDKEEHTSSATTQEVSQLVFSRTLYNYRYVDSATYIIMVPHYISFTDPDASGTVYE